MVIVPGGRRRTMSRTSVGRHLAGAPGREVEAEGVGAQGDRQQGVLLVRDAADLHEHVYDGTGRIGYGNTITLGASPDRGTGLSAGRPGSRRDRDVRNTADRPRDRLGDRWAIGWTARRTAGWTAGWTAGSGSSRGRVPATSSPATDPSSSAPTWSWSRRAGRHGPVRPADGAGCVLGGIVVVAWRNPRPLGAVPHGLDAAVRHPGQLRPDPRPGRLADPACPPRAAALDRQVHRRGHASERAAAGRRTSVPTICTGTTTPCSRCISRTSSPRSSSARCST